MKGVYIGTGLDRPVTLARSVWKKILTQTMKFILNGLTHKSNCPCSLEPKWLPYLASFRLGLLYGSTADISHHSFNHFKFAQFYNTWIFTSTNFLRFLVEFLKDMRYNKAQKMIHVQSKSYAPIGSKQIIYSCCGQLWV